MHHFCDMDLARRYHGHLGPNLVIGIKLGNYAVNKLGARTHFGIRAEVHCPAGPPVSCMIDGIQLSSGCTLGKANIVHWVSDDVIKAIFTNTDTGKSVTLRVKREFIDEALRCYREEGEDTASNRTWETPDDQVFTECDN